MKTPNIVILIVIVLLVVIALNFCQQDSTYSSTQNVVEESEPELIDPGARRGLHSENLLAREYAEKAIGFMSNGNYSEAIKYYELAVKEDPYHSIYRSQLGSNYYASGDMFKAEDNWSRALEIDQKNKSALVGLAIIKHNRGEFENAIVLGEKVLSYDSTHDAAMWGLAHSYAALGDYKTSIDYYHKFLLYSRSKVNSEIAKKKIIELEQKMRD